MPYGMMSARNVDSSPREAGIPWYVWGLLSVGDIINFDLHVLVLGALELYLDSLSTAGACCMQSPSTWIYIYMYIQRDVCVCVCVRTYLCIYVYVYVHV